MMLMFLDVMLLGCLISILGFNVFCLGSLLWQWWVFASCCLCVLVTWFWWFCCLVARLFRFVGGLSGLLLWLLLFG